MELYILDKSFNLVKVISNYKSVIWAKRYLENGDCELVLPLGDIKKVFNSLELAANTQSDYIDISNYSELRLSNETIPRTGANPAHFGIYFYKDGVEQGLLDMDSYLDNGNSFDISEYEGLKFYVSYTSGNYSLSYRLQSNGILDVIRPGYYIVRSDDDMICRIKDLTVETDRDNGDKVTVKAYDMKSILDQRYMYGPYSINTTTHSFIYHINHLISRELQTWADENGNRTMIGYYNSDSVDEWSISDKEIDIQNEQSALGEYIRKQCSDNGIGIKVILEKIPVGPQLELEYRLTLILYDGSNKTSSVVFSDEIGNLLSSKYSLENNNYYNACLIKTNDSETSDKYTFCYPDDVGGFAGDDKLATGSGPLSIDRFETSFDSDIAYSPDYETLRDTLYPGGTLTTNTAGTQGEYKVSDLKIECVTSRFKEWLQDHYTGTITTENGVEYFNIPSQTAVAKLSRATNTESWKVKMTTVAMYAALWNAAKVALAENTPKETFEGTVIPNGQFKYKTDYDLGDVVRIENKYGISADARIIEVIESIDENGENLSLSFENKNIKMA